MSESGKKHPDSGFECLALVARFHQQAADASQLQHHFGSTDAESDGQTLVRATRSLGLKATLKRVGWKQLSQLALPAVAATQDGR